MRVFNVNIVNKSIKKPKKEKAYKLYSKNHILHTKLIGIAHKKKNIAKRVFFIGTVNKLCK